MNSTLPLGNLRLEQSFRSIPEIIREPLMSGLSHLVAALPCKVNKRDIYDTRLFATVKERIRNLVLKLPKFSTLTFSNLTDIDINFLDVFLEPMRSRNIRSILNISLPSIFSIRMHSLGTMIGINAYLMAAVVSMGMVGLGNIHKFFQNLNISHAKGIGGQISRA